MLYNDKANLRKVPKKSSDRLKVPKHSKKTREQIEKTSLLEKAKWELKIMELQEKMFETPVTIEYLKHIAKYFQPAHYEEVVLERKSLNICGYPLCNKKTQQLKGKYRLSSSKKKIFDITELKSYCGSDCMLSSRYFASQLLDEPIYLRNFETMKDVDVIPLGVNIEEWILREHQKLNTYTERSLDTYVKNMVQTLPSLNKNLVIHEHFGNNQNDNGINNHMNIDKSSFHYDSIEGYQYKPKTNKTYKSNKPSTIILDKELINSYSNSLSKSSNNNNGNSLKKNKSKEKLVSSVILNKEEADKFNELYEQYAQKMKEEDTQKKEQKIDDINISENLTNIKIDNKTIATAEKENADITEKNNEKIIVKKLNKLNINNDINNKKHDELIINSNINNSLPTNNIINDNNSTSNYRINDDNSEAIPKLKDNDNKVKAPQRKKSTSILKKSNSISKDNLKVRFNEDPSIKIIESKDDMNKAYRETEKEKFKKNRNKKQTKNNDVFYSYDVIEKNNVKKDVIESNKFSNNNSKEVNIENENKKENEDKINKEPEKNDNDNDEEKSKEKIKSLFEMNKDLEKILKITEMTKEEAKNKKKKKLVPTLSLFGQIWTTISRMITNETKLFLNNKVTENELNEMLLVDDDIMNTRKNILISNIMKSYSSIKLEHKIMTAIEDELILLIKSFIVNESMVILSSVEYWILTVVFLKALTKKNKLLDEEISEEKWKEMIEVVDIPYYQLTEFVNLFN